MGALTTRDAPQMQEYTPAPAWEQESGYSYPERAKVRESRTRVAVRGRGENPPTFAYERRKLSVDGGSGAAELNGLETLVCAAVIAVVLFGIYIAVPPAVRFLAAIFG